jgi:hypothetical protein
VQSPQQQILLASGHLNFSQRALHRFAHLIFSRTMRALVIEDELKTAAYLRQPDIAAL